MVQRLCDQRGRDFARRDPIWREQPSYRRILFQGSSAGVARGCRDRSARCGRSAVHQGSARRLESTPSADRRDAMPVYTVHAPGAGGSDLRSTDRFVFVRDGFHFWAMLFGPLWLIAHRLWLALIGWLIAVIALELLLRRLGVGSAALV